MAEKRKIYYICYIQFYTIMTKSYRFFFVLFFILFSKILTSQSLVATQDNYAGSATMSMNPALMNSSNVYFDFSLANVGLSIFNDYAYIEGRDMSSFMFSKEHMVPAYNMDGAEYNFLIYDNPEMKPNNIYEFLDVNVLRFMLNLDGRQSLGLSFNMRVYTNGIDLPHEIPDIVLKGLENDGFNGRYVSSDASISTMEWAEVAMSYSRKLYDRYQSRVDVGVGVKYLLGYSAAVANINNLDYEIFGEDSIVVNRFDADLAYSLPINYNENFVSGSVFNSSLVRGNGLAFDLGFTYAYKKSVSNDRRILTPCMQPKLNYLWKLGVSLMDVGFISFKNNAIDNSFDASEEMLFDRYVFDDVKSFGDMVGFMSAMYYDGDSLASVVADNFKVGLPTTLRLQFDYNIKDNYYVNATVVQPLKLMKYSVRAVPQLMVEARYESDLYGFSLPLTLRDYSDFLIGASARMAFVTVGTQNIASYLGFGKVNGMDIFVSVKFNLVKGKCAHDRYDACWSSDFGNKKYRR